MTETRKLECPVCHREILSEDEFCGGAFTERDHPSLVKPVPATHPAEDPVEGAGSTLTDAVEVIQAIAYPDLDWQVEPLDLKWASELCRAVIKRHPSSWPHIAEPVEEAGVDAGSPNRHSAGQEPDSSPGAVASVDSSPAAEECNCSPGLPQTGEIGKYTTAGCPVHGFDCEPREGR